MKLFIKHSKYLLLLAVASTIASSCTEVYDGHTKLSEEVLVVRALLTNQDEPQKVVLQNTTGFGQELQQQPVRFAFVYVENQDGEKFTFSEQEPGVYVNEEIQAEENQQYTLRIELRSGHVYQSLPQELNPVSPLESVYGFYDSKLTDIPDNMGEPIPTYMEGVEVFTDLNTDDQFSNLIRFQPEILYQYRERIHFELCTLFVPHDHDYCTIYSADDPPILHCRTKRPLKGDVNLVDPEFESVVGDLYQHSLGFVPKEKKHIPLSFNGSIDARILLTNKLGLTDEAYSFYRAMKEQLAADNALFDPVATQLEGNITCITEPGKIVLGLFEVSGSEKQSFVLNKEPPVPGDIEFNEIPDLSFLPEHRCFLETVPEFWVLQ